jgi:hypothetical protein
VRRGPLPGSKNTVVFLLVKGGKEASLKTNIQRDEKWLLKESNSKPPPR